MLAFLIENPLEHIVRHPMIRRNGITLLDSHIVMMMLAAFLLILLLPIWVRRRRGTDEVGALVPAGAGNAIEAIKLLRASTGLGWKEARDGINRQLRNQPPAPGTKAGAPASLPMTLAAALRTDDPEQALRLLREKIGLGAEAAKDAVKPVGNEAARAGSSGLAPGEVPRSSNSLWRAVLLAAAAFLVYRLFGRSG